MSGSNLLFAICSSLLLRINSLASLLTISASQQNYSCHRVSWTSVFFFWQLLNGSRVHGRDSEKPCRHEGPCRKENGCSCRKQSMYCQRNCGCDTACANCCAVEIIFQPSAHICLQAHDGGKVVGAQLQRIKHHADLTAAPVHAGLLDESAIQNCAKTVALQSMLCTSVSYLCAELVST